MSGRVRWRPWLGYRHVRELCVDGATVGELLTYSDHVRARYYVATPDDSWRRTFRRRSDAKRWLLARAAGLAEVPRRERVRGCTVVRGWHVGRSHRHGYALPSKCATWPPRWWRIVEEYVDEDVNVTCALVERNRRRR